MMTTQTGLGVKELLAEKRDAIIAIASKHGAFNVRVFGSAARGTANENSDIDFLVEFEPERTLFDRVGFKQDLEALLDRRVDVAKPSNLNERIRDKVLQEAVAL